MLGKLFKYDFKALSRVMLPLQGGVLLVGILGCFLVNVSFRSLYNSSDYGHYSSSSSALYSLESMLNGATAMLGELLFAVASASSWVTLLLIARHFYQNLLKDEGYLSFTLPVTKNQQFLSKTLSGLVWFLINMAILLLVGLLFTVVGFSVEGTINSDVIEAYRYLLEGLSNAFGAAFFLELSVLIILTALASVLQIYLALILGSVAARTYKVLASVGIYIIIQIALQTLTIFVSLGLLIFSVLEPSYSYSEFSWLYLLQPVMLAMLALYAVCVAVFYLVGKHMLETKLNLD